MWRSGCYCLFINFLSVTVVYSHDVQKRQAVNIQSPPVWQALDVLRGSAAPNAAEVAILMASAVPGRSYPTLSFIPQTSFTCSSVHQPGFYADPDTGCQVFRRCEANNYMFSYICPNTTLFNQITLVCDYWYNVQCQASNQFVDYSNPRIYNQNAVLLDDVNIGGASGSGSFTAGGGSVGGGFNAGGGSGGGGFIGGGGSGSGNFVDGSGGRYTGGQSVGQIGGGGGSTTGLIGGSGQSGGVYGSGQSGNAAFGGQNSGQYSGGGGSGFNGGQSSGSYQPGGGGANVIGQGATGGSSYTGGQSGGLISQYGRGTSSYGSSQPSSGGYIQSFGGTSSYSPSSASGAQQQQLPFGTQINTRPAQSSSTQYQTGGQQQPFQQPQPQFQPAGYASQQAQQAQSPYTSSQQQPSFAIQAGPSYRSLSNRLLRLQADASERVNDFLTTPSQTATPTATADFEVL